MTADPFNQLPTDPEWLRKADAITVHAARELGCFALLVAAQENGKLAVITEGMPETGAIADMYRAAGAPGLLGGLSFALMSMESHDKTRARS